MILAPLINLVLLMSHTAERHETMLMGGGGRYQLNTSKFGPHRDPWQSLHSRLLCLMLFLILEPEGRSHLVGPRYRWKNILDIKDLLQIQDCGVRSVKMSK
jgi:hypothetical protein